MFKNDHVTTNHHSNGAAGVAAGLFIGSMIGAATMWLFAPQSGKRTRAEIQLKSMEVRDRAAEMLEETAAQMRIESKKLVMNGRHKVKEIVVHGQELAKNQITNISEKVQHGTNSILHPKMW